MYFNIYNMEPIWDQNLCQKRNLRVQLYEKLTFGCFIVGNTPDLGSDKGRIDPNAHTQFISRNFI